MNWLLWFLFSPRGRVSRLAFLAWMLATLAVAYFGWHASGLRDFDLFSGMLNLALLWPTLVINIKRLHDTNRSGWWLLVIFVPILGALVLFVLTWLWPGTEGANDYGHRPGPPGVW